MEVQSCQNTLSSWESMSIYGSEGRTGITRRVQIPVNQQYGLLIDRQDLLSQCRALSFSLWREHQSDSRHNTCNLSGYGASHPRQRFVRISTQSLYYDAEA